MACERLILEFSGIQRLRGLAEITAISLLVAASIGCTAPRPAQTSSPPESGRPGCLQMLSHYCEKLDAPEKRGNLDVEAGRDHRIQVRLGKNEEGLPTIEEQFLRSLNERRARLPQDFREALETIRFFDGLHDTLHLRGRITPGTAGRLSYEGTALTLDGQWLDAVSETVKARLQRKLGFAVDSLEDDLPTELTSAIQATRTQLILEISRAIWRDHPQWKRVRQEFEQVRGKYLQMIARLDLPPGLRRRWNHRLSTARLLFPGENPYVDDFECISSETNAFYYTGINAIEVCAGEFLGESFIETLAHELGHALDFDADLMQHQEESLLGVKLAALRAQACAPASISCESWSRFKKDFEGDLHKLGDFKPPLPDFQSCSSGKKPRKPLSHDDIHALADAEVSESISQFAEGESFSGIVSPVLRMPGGRSVKNPSYLDPCGYEPGSGPGMPLPVDDPVNLLLFSVAEYQCSGARGPLSLRRSIQTAKQLGIQITEELLKIEGPFSSRERLIEGGYSFSPVEHFADTLASYVLSEILSPPMPLSERRAVFLAGSSVGCSESLREGKSPQMASVEQEFALDPHGMGTARSVLRFTQPLREALECRNDLPVQGCELDFKKPSNPSH